MHINDPLQQFGSVGEVHLAPDFIQGGGGGGGGPGSGGQFFSDISSFVL